MELRSLGVAVLLLAALGAPEARADLRFEPALLDFGRQPENKVSSASVRVTNAGSVPVGIVGALPDCGCITVEFPASALAPGASATLKVRMQSGGVENDARHEIALALEGGGTVVLPVRISVYRYANWTVSPSRLMFAPSRRGEAAVADLRVSHVGAAGPGIVSVSSGSPYIGVAGGVTAGNAVTYRVTKLPAAPGGPIYADIRITTGDPQERVLDIPVFAYVIP